jgi:hypothetical protein
VCSSSKKEEWEKGKAGGREREKEKRRGIDEVEAGDRVGPCQKNPL